MNRLVRSAFLLIAAVSLPARAEQLLDDEWTIKPGASQKYTVTLNAPATVHVEIFGVKHADKGFKVRLSDEGTEVTRSFRRTAQWQPGPHVIEVRNTENLLNRVTVRIRLTASPHFSAAPKHSQEAKPERVGQCVQTNVASVGTRLEGAHGAAIPGSGTAIRFSNGVALVSYEAVPEAEASSAGDTVTLCLSSAPSDCPPGDDRGKVYTVTNKRTNKKFSMQNSQHSCGGA